MIEAAMQCPCGTNVTIDRTDALVDSSRWVCLCPDCYDPTDGGGTAGYGPDPESAVDEWWAKVEESREVCWELTPAGNMVVEVRAQAKLEAKRQSGWGTYRGPLGDFGDSCDWYGPAPVDIGERGDFVPLGVLR